MQTQEANKKQVRGAYQTASRCSRPKSAACPIENEKRVLTSAAQAISMQTLYTKWAGSWNVPLEKVRSAISLKKKA